MLRITLLLSLAALACQAAPASDDAAFNHLYNSVIIGDYETAVAESKDLYKENRGVVISKTVRKLLNYSQRNVMDYAYKLYQNDGKDIINYYFPVHFRSIFGEYTVKLISKRDGMAIKLGVRIDSDGDRTAYGDNSDLIGDRVGWKLIPYVSDSRLYFKIYNGLYNQYLKLGIATDSDGDHEAYGSTESNTSRHQWYLHPVKYNDELLFYIFNREYNHALKLSRAIDSDGDRQLFSEKGNVHGFPGQYGWIIAPF